MNVNARMESGESDVRLMTMIAPANRARMVDCVQTQVVLLSMCAYFGHYFLVDMTVPVKFRMFWFFFFDDFLIQSMIFIIFSDLKDFTPVNNNLSKCMEKEFHMQMKIVEHSAIIFWQGTTINSTGV